MEKVVFDKDQLQEDLAEALHELWVTWSKTLTHEEEIFFERKIRCQVCGKPCGCNWKQPIGPYCCNCCPFVCVHGKKKEKPISGCRNQI